MYMNNILVDNRVSECISVLSTVLSKADMDASYVVIYPDNHMYCISGETLIVHSLLLYSIQNNIDTLYIDMKSTLEIQAIPNEIDEDGKVKSYLYDSNYYVPLEDIFIKNDINNYLSMYKEVYPIILYKEDFSNSEEFDPYRGLKADDGAVMYKNIGTDNSFLCFPMFSGFPKLSKSDSMNLTVYKQNNNYNIVKFDIYKKKLKHNIDILFRVMNLDR